MGRLFSYFFDLILAVVIWKMVRKLFGSLSNPSAPRSIQNTGGSSVEHVGKTARDPVCHMFVSTDLPYRLVRGSETLHFCSRECLERYQKESVNA
jgi:YHS domain-containing protein